jgi:tetratricopeptide (TPR) repeat protein
MSAFRLVKWSSALLVAASTVTYAQDQASPQKLLETGRYDAAVERAADGRGGSPEDTYVAALAYLKMGNNDGAAAELRRLQEQGDQAWQRVGASGVAMVEDNDGEAVNAGRQATEMSGDNPFTHYQLGMAAARANDFGTAAHAFERASELRPDFAYAHYYAGQSFQKERNMQKAAEHYQYFVQLAPDSPDRVAVQGILRTLRK